MGIYPRFNEQLGDRNRRYTFFVPRDKAWLALERISPSLYKKLFMNDYSYHANMVLERHLVVADRIFTMADLQRMANGSFVALTAIRGQIKIKVREEEKSTYAIMLA